MRSASNPGANGQVLLLNGSTGRPYWGDPTIEGGINYLVTSGVARVNGRYVTTNYTVTVSNGTWDGSTATLTPTGTITVVSSVPIARWEYVKADSDAIRLNDEINTGAWESQAHGLLTAGDIYSVRSAGEPSGIPSVGGSSGTISVSNLVVWTWGAPGMYGTTNDFQGTVLMVDDPAGELDAVNLRTMQAAVAGIDRSPSAWATYDAAGNPNKTDGVNMGGRRVYLDNQWSLLGSGQYCALSYCGRDIMYVSMSNKLLSVSSFVAGPVITVAVSTNGVTSRPWIEYTRDLGAGNWLEITNATSTYPVKTNGAYVMTFSNVWPTAFFRAVQASTNIGLVVTVPLTVPAITLGGVTKTAWPVGATGPAGPPGTNVMVFVGSEVGPVGPAGRDGRDGLPGQDGVIGRDGLPGISPTIAVTDPLVGEAAVTNVGTSTNVVLQFTLPPGPQGPAGPGMTNMPAVWDADLIGTNALYYKVNGETTARFDTNGLTMLKGSIQLFEEDLYCNVLRYDGSRTAPSETYAGHPGEYGTYGRGFNGRWCHAWAVGGTEIGVFHAGGISLMSTNFSFSGTHVGDISGATGYPEPIFTAWQTNMNFTTLTLSNLVVTPGAFDVKDTLNTTRTRLDTTGMTYKDAGGVIRSTIGEDVIMKDGLGRTVAKVNYGGLTTYDAPSQMPILRCGAFQVDAITCHYTAGNLVYSLSGYGGLKLYDPYQTTYRFGVTYQGMEILNASSQAVFNVNSGTTPLITMWSTAITNSGNLTFYGNNGTNLLTLTGASGDIKAMGRATVGNLSITNNGSVSFYGANGVFLTTLTATNGAVQAFGRSIFATNWPSGNYTNLSIGGKTNVFQMFCGNVTNVLVL
jgi:hypothetical protein